MAEVKPATMERDFSKVILTLENVLIPDEKLSPTPSMQDGLDLETETDLRILGCELIQTSGILLKLPQVAMATGQVLFQRFYYSKSFVKHNMEVLAMACVNLASKIEECPRRIRDVINTFHHVKQVRNQKNIHALVLDQNYINLKNQVIKAERRVLKELGFCVHVKHPHKVTVVLIFLLKVVRNKVMFFCTFYIFRNYMNDSFRTDVFVRYNPETIACACIWLAARQLQVPLPNSPPWYELFGVIEEDIREICLTILRLYARKRPNPDALEKKVNAVRTLQLEAKKKAKGLFSERDTPNSTSRQNSPKNVSPNPTTLIGELKKRIKKEAEEKHDGDGSKRRKNGVSRSRSRSRSRSSRSSRSYSPAQKKRKRKESHTKKI
ncbi:cyclin-L1-like [Ruditapes philippinarum]|uniref:cyclin-L1-like n=1 Tax=Ruditapes philippinarum TaxID=129788 RepID=UPI00295ABA7E|nr:cyclin-L1-like [Ruditapes philippinarum]